MFRPLIISLSIAACAHSSASPISSLQFSSERQAARGSYSQAVAVSDSAKTASAISQDVKTAQTQSSTHQSPASNNAKQPQREQVIALGRSLIGTPYLWGGTTPNGFDCSGFVSYIYGKHGFSLPRTSNEQFSRLNAVDTPAPGDLVFFRSKSGRISHVGMYIGNGNMLHSPQSGEKVRIESMEKPNWKRRYAGARRILPQGGDNGKTLMVAANSASPKTAATPNAVQLNARPNAGTGDLFRIK